MTKLPIDLAGICSAALAAALLAVPAPAHANDTKVYSYAVKFVCEEEEGNSVDTSVNFHNPSLTSRAQYLLKIVTTEEEESAYHVFRSGYLPPDLGGSVECDAFEQQNGGPGIDITDFEGFLVVLSRKPLDVVGVYEVEHEDDEGEEVEDLDVVPVQGKVQTVPLSVWNNLIPAT